MIAKGLLLSGSIEAFAIMEMSLCQGHSASMGYDIPAEVPRSSGGKRASFRGGNSLVPA